MLYIFSFLSVLSPTFFLQSRLLDSPLAPTIGVQQTCIAKVCVVFPRPGTSLQDFVHEIPHSDLPTIGISPRATTPGCVEGDDDDGGGGGCRKIEGGAYAPPFYPAQQQSPPSTENLFSVMLPSVDRIREDNINWGSVIRITFAGPPSSAPRPFALPRCLMLDKARHLRNDTCSYAVSGNDADNLSMALPSFVDPHPLDQPRCLLTDKALHLVNETCSATILSPSPSIKVIINSRPVPQQRCLMSDKALHLLNDTCVLATSVNRPLERIAGAELPTFDAIPYQPMSVFSLSCLSSSQARRGAPQTCGYNTVPNLATALDWNIRMQATLLSSQVVDQTPVFLVAPIEPEPLTCRRCRDPGLVAASPESVAIPALTMPRASATRGHTTLFESSRLRSIRMTHIVVAILSVLGCLFRGTEQTEQLEGLDAVSEIEEPLTEMIPAETVNFVAPKDDVPPPTPPKTNPSPAKAKCRVVAGKRVQPLRGCRTTPTPAPEQASSSGTSIKKGRKAKASRP